MGEYTTSKKDMNFCNLDELKTVQGVIDEADMALQDRSRNIEDSPLKEVLARAIKGGIGMTFATLYTGNPAIGLNVAAGKAAKRGLLGGASVLALGYLPVAVLGGVGVGIASHTKNKKLQKEKELIYKNAIAKQNAIINALVEERDDDKKRIEYLNGINIVLQTAIKDLAKDIESVA